MLLLLPNAIPDARAQQERKPSSWISPCSTSGSSSCRSSTSSRNPGEMPQSEEAARALIEGACANAGFDSYNQCAEVLGYVGMIVSTWDPRTRSFRDPMPQMRSQLARLEADTGWPTPPRSRPSRR